MAHLKVRYSDGGTSEIPLPPGAEVILGRQPDCDVVLGESVVSRRHARLASATGGWTISDLNSSMGTFVNGERVSTRLLQAGDEIHIGGAVLVFDARNVGSGPSRVLPPRQDAADPWTQESTGDRERPAPQVLESRRVDESELMRKARTIQAVDLRQLVQDHLSSEEAKQLAPGAPKANTLAQTDAQLLALVRIGTEIHRCADVESVCEVAVEMAMHATGADRGILALRGAGERWKVKAQRILQKGVLVPASVRVSRTFVQRVLEKREGMIARDVGQDLDLSGAKSIVAMDIRSMVCVPLVKDEDLLGWLYLDKIGVGSTFGARDLDMLSLIAFQAGAEIGRLDEQERHRSLSRFFSKDVMRHIEELGPNAVDAQSLTVTVLFADIQGFTRISESLEPSELKAMLDHYFSRMLEIAVDKWGATLDKYIGDAIMALFGAPFSKGPEIDAVNAVAASLEMLKAVAHLREQDPRFADLHIRIGVNTGKVFAGYLGAPQRIEYSVLGDTVNVASRLESTGEPDRIQIGDATCELVKRKFHCEPAGERKLKNRDAPMKCWWVTGMKADVAITGTGSSASAKRR